MSLKAMNTPAKKHLGQHFLTDTQTVARVVEAISSAPNEAIVEIGPGLGALTAPVLERGAASTPLKQRIPER